MWYSYYSFNWKLQFLLNMIIMPLFDNQFCYLCLLQIVCMFTTGELCLVSINIMCICKQFQCSNMIQHLIIEMQKCLVLQSWISIDSYITTWHCLHNVSIILPLWAFILFHLWCCNILSSIIFNPMYHYTLQSHDKRRRVQMQQMTE